MSSSSEPLPDPAARPARSPGSEPPRPSGDSAAESAAELAAAAGSAAETRGPAAALPRGAPPLAGPRAEPLPPKVPGYRVHEVIGRGSTGTVYRATQTAVERDVALKVLHPELARNARLVRRLQREARTMARLAHRHVVSAIDMGEADGTWWFAMELVDGPSLADRLRLEGHLGEREALRFFLQLSEALEHLWEHGVVHRDIKPANIMIDRTHGALLADLGLAFHDRDPGLTRQGGTLGTPHYISPEQARDPHAVDVRTDLWSFGATLFHTLCGRPPFQGESLAEVLSAVLHARVPDPRGLVPDLSAGLALVVRKCLVRDPDLRYQTPRELRMDLERVRERRAPSVRRASLDPVERPPSTWRRVFWLSLGSAAAAALVVFVVAKRLDPAEAPEPTAALTPLEYLPLEQLRERVRQRPQRLAGAMSDLERMREEVPAALSAVWWSVRNEFWDLLRQRSGELRAGLGAQIDAALAARDLVESERLLQGELERRLRQETGYSLEELPEEVGGPLTRWYAERAAAFEAARANEVAALGEAARRHLEEIFLPAVRSDLEAQRWQSARRRLTYDAGRFAQAAGLDVAGIPLGALEDAFSEVRAELAAQRRQLDDAWLALDRDLRGFVRERARELESQLGGRALPGARRELEDALEAELALRGLDRSEWPQVGLAATSGELMRSGQALERAEGVALRAALEARFALYGDRLEPALLRRRDYGRARELWGGFESWLEQIAEASPPWAGERWFTDLGAQVRLRQAEVELLAGLLERVAVEVVRRRGESLELSVGNIRMQGTLESGLDPLADGFQFRSAGRVFHLDLRSPLLSGDSRRLALMDHERLAGLVPGAAEALDPEQRLALALLRRREGDQAGARQALAAGPWPGEAPLANLAQELSRDLLEGLRGGGAEISAPAARARTLLDALDAPGPALDRVGSLTVLDVLLGEYLDQPAVYQRSLELGILRDNLRRAAPRAPEGG